MPSIDSSTSADLTQQDRSGMSRRSVVRAGVAAAWAVPLVQVAAAAPSFAASGPADLSTSTSGTPSRTADTLTIPNVRLINTNNQATTALTVKIVSSITVANQQSAPAGWTVATSGNGANRKTVSFTKAVQLGANTALPAVTFRIAFQNGAASAQTVTASPGATGTGVVFGTFNVA